MISLLTCTGGRPEAFELCKRWMSQQTFKGNVQWVIVDDVNDAPEEFILETKKNLTIVPSFVNPTPKWKEGKNTQRRNMVLGLQACKGDTIFIIEDDDYYSPTYLERSMALMRFTGAEVLGYAAARYYSLPTASYKQMQNRSHASLCETVLTIDHRRRLIDACNSGSQWFDVAFWDNVQDNAVKSCLLAGLSEAVGIKGLPGRSGIGQGHQGGEGFTFDWKAKKLAQWVGKDAQHYEKYLMPDYGALWNQPKK